MCANSYENLQTIRFNGELLPKWAQLLDVAAGLQEVPKETRQWFSRFTQSPGTDDSRTIISQCEILRSTILGNHAAVIEELQRTKNDAQPGQVFAAWRYSLDTMIQSAACAETCSWCIEGVDSDSAGDFGDGDINLRRV